MKDHTHAENQRRNYRKGLQRREYRATAFLLVLGMLLWMLEWAVDYYVIRERYFLEPLISVISTHKNLLPIVWIICFLAYAIYITRISRKIEQMEKDLDESEERYRLLTQNSITGIYIHLAGRLVYANGRFEIITGYSQTELLNRSFWELVHPEDRDMVKDRDLARAEGQPVVSQSQFRILSKTGEVKWVEVLAAVLDYDGLAANMGNVADVTERKEAEKQREELISDLLRTREALHFRATHDGLTGILNRAAVFDALEREMARAAREKRPLAVIMVDVDHFKAVNDRFGHLIGDEVLKEIAGRISASVRPYDIVGRYGGEELLIALSGCDEPGALNFSERVRAAISDEPINTREGSISVTISIGAAIYSGTYLLDTDDLVKSADSALYCAKEDGRNCVKISRMPESIPSRVKIV